MKKIASFLFVIAPLLTEAQSLKKLLNKTVNKQPTATPAAEAVKTPTLPTNLKLPPTISFEWLVQQRNKKDDNNGYNDVTYYFTTAGDYAAVKPTDKSFSLMVYTKEGMTLLIDDGKKIITVMSMPKTIGEGAVPGKTVAEQIKKTSLKKDNDTEKFSIIKTGKTKTVAGYTAMEYQMKNNKASSSVPTMSFWYVKTPFDPVKIYTMGVGRPADLSKMQNDPKMKNNMTAIPVLNKNYLWVETEMGNMKGLETTEIKKVSFTVSTTGYTIKGIKGTL